MDRAEGVPCRIPWLDISGAPVNIHVQGMAADVAVGVGVRAGVYVQAILIFLCGVYCLYLTTQYRDRRHTWARKALSNLSLLGLGLSLHVYTFMHARNYGLSTYDTSVHTSLSWLIDVSALLIAFSNWLLSPLDIEPDTIVAAQLLPATMILFSMGAMASNLAAISPAKRPWSCTHYGYDPPYATPVQLDPRLLKGFIFTFDILIDHLMTLFVPQVVHVTLGAALSTWIEQSGLRIPKDWSQKDMVADPLKTVSRASFKVVAVTQIGLLFLCTWATRNVRRVGWSLLFCVLVCGTIMVGFIGWTETVVAGIERPKGIQREELWKQRLAFSVLILPAVMMIPRLWLIPYLKSIVQDGELDRKQE
ncbi:hypothetical protein CALVIDRAFT_435808 [Calocera viscosa TUFC12733]|uniref:Uncharacterized protein n=1 Tax=Calocera viscosa (strain TUFC12733) TaxID=1330018 RepID=A0A167FW72_CALVF|nr:hypothetical protein CALVIDRAFT_435808 [Calocera viscosa TUFC12733]